MAPRKPKTVPPIPVDDNLSTEDWFNQTFNPDPFTTTTTTTTVPKIPSTTIPVTPSTPGTFTLPVSTGGSTGLIKAEQRLKSTEARARALGINVPKGLASSGTYAAQAPTSPEVDEYLASVGIELPKAKGDDDGFWESLGKGALGALSDVVNVVDVGRRFVVSTLKEGGDLLSGGDASFGEWWDQLNDPNLSSAILLPDIGPKWLQSSLAFAGDILLDPTTYLTLGGSAIAKTSVKVGTNLALKEVAEATTEKLVKAGVDKLAIEAAQKTAKDLADDAIRVADDLGRGVGTADDLVMAQQRAQRAEQAARDLTLDAAKKLDGRGGKILKAEDARQAAYQKWSNTIDGSAAQKAARKELDSATSYLARQGLIRGGARRQYRATAREILGENATQVRNMADNLIKAGDAKIAAGLTLDATEEAVIAAAKRTAADLSDEVIADIYKRGYGALRGAGEGAGLALGTRTGSRLGIGRASVYLGKGKVTGLGGSALTKLRAGAFAKAPGVLEWITPLGRKGIFSDADLLKMRRALQTGIEDGRKLEPGVAKVYGAAIGLQRAEEVVRKRVEGALINSAKNALIDITDEEAPQIVKYLEDGVPLADAGLQAKADGVRGWLDATYKEYADKVAALGDVPKVGMANYFPHVQSTDALEWLAKNPRKADELAKSLGVTRQYLADNFVERELIPGRVWFGQVLTADDIKGGVTRLNELARMGGFKGDFFETNLKKALGRYAQKHAANVAFLDTVEKLAGQNVDEILERLKSVDPSAGYLDDITKVVPEARATDSLLQRAVKDVTQGDVEAISNALTDLAGVLNLNYTPLRLRQWSKAGVFEVEQRMIQLRNTLDDVLTQGDTAVAEQFIKQVNDLQNRVIQLANSKDIVPAAARLTLDEIDQTIERVIIQSTDPAEIQAAIDAGLTLRQVTPSGQPLVGASIDNILSLFGRTTEDRWKEISRSFSDGFEALGMRDIPDIAARKEVIQMFNRLQQVTDQKFAAGLERAIGDFNTFFKSWSTATVGFHFRNAMSNAFQLVAAGVGPRSMSEGAFWYNRYLKDTTERASRKAGTFLTPDEWVKTLPPRVSAVKRQQIADALYLTGADGQMSDVFNEARRIGITGKEVGDTATLKRTRGVLGSPLKTSRAVGQYVEGNSRFIMNFDALGKGLSPEEAVARTNKYLFDYQNLSSLDRVVKNIIPFWIWTSRNFPLYLENIVTNPRAYARYGQFRRTAEGEEIPYMPASAAEAGGFALRPEIAGLPGVAGFTGGDNRYFRPDFGFPGAGRPSQLDLLARALPQLLAGKPEETVRALRETVGSSTPLLQIPIELATGRSLFRDQPIASKYSGIPEAEQRLLYGVGKVLPAYQYLGRQANTITGLGALLGISPETTQSILNVVAPDTERQRIIAGVPEPFTEGMTEEEIADRAQQAAFGAVEAFIGSPVRGLTEGQQIAEINRRIRALEELILRERNARGL